MVSVWTHVWFLLSFLKIAVAADKEIAGILKWKREVELSSVK